MPVFVFPLFGVLFVGVIALIIVMLSLHASSARRFRQLYPIYERRYEIQLGMPRDLVRQILAGLNVEVIARGAGDKFIIKEYRTLFTKVYYEFVVMYDQYNSVISTGGSQREVTRHYY